MKSPKSNSSQGLVNYILDRSDSFTKTYNLLKNILIGESDKQITVIDSEDNEILINQGSIFSNIKTLVRDTSPSVKVWPTFSLNEYFPISNNNNEYENISNSEGYSIIRLNNIDSAKYHHITIKGSLIINPVVFIVLDKTFTDGEVFEFKVNFIEIIGSNEPVVVFLDGTYCNIKSSNNGKYINIDGIDYVYSNSNDLIYDITKYNNKEYVGVLDDNEPILISVNNNKQIINKIYGNSKKINLSSLNKKYFDNYGMFDNEYLITYYNNDIHLTCDNLIDHSNLNDLDISCENNSIKYSTKNGQMYVIGIDDNRIPLSSYDILSFGTRIANDKTSNTLINNYPNQLGENQTNGQIGLEFKSKYENSEESVICHKIGISKSDVYCLIRKSQSTLEVYIEGGVELINLASTSTELDIIVGFYVKKSETYMRVMVCDETSKLVDIIEKVSSYSTLTPYIQTYLTHSSGISPYSVTISEYIIIDNLNNMSLNGLFGKKDRFTNYLSQDLDEDIPLSEKVLPIKNIEGYLLTLNGKPKINISMNGLSEQDINSISYRSSFIYNKNKSDFYYIPKTSYKFKTDTGFTGISYSKDCNNIKSNKGFSYGTNKSIYFDRCNKVLKYSDIFSYVDKKYEIEVPEKETITRKIYRKLNNNESESYCLSLPNFTNLVADNKIAQELNVSIGSNVDLIEYNKNLSKIKSINMWCGFSIEISTESNIRDLVGTKFELHSTNNKISTTTINENTVFNSNVFVHFNGYYYKVKTNLNNYSTTEYYNPSKELITKDAYSLAGNIEGTSISMSGSGGIIKITCEYTYYYNSNVNNSYISTNNGTDNNNGVTIHYEELSCEKINLTNVNEEIKGELILYSPTNEFILKSPLILSAMSKYAYRVEYVEKTLTGQKPMWVDVSGETITPKVTLAPTYDLKINFKKIESEYIDTYKDYGINNSGWKLFGFYQLPINI